MAEKERRKIVRTIELIYSVTQHKKQIEIKCLLKEIYVSSVNRPISVGIDPVSSFEAINII